MTRPRETTATATGVRCNHVHMLRRYGPIQLDRVQLGTARYPLC
jgi:hypothetical protein